MLVKRGCFKMFPNIRAEMARKSYTSEMLSKAINLSANSFRFKLSGKREFTLAELTKIADIFDCSIDYLVGRTNKGA